MSYYVEAFSAETMLVGESPLWHHGEQTLYWVDIEGFAIHSLKPSTGEHRKWPMASEPSALAMSAGGGLAVATRAGFMQFNPEDGTLHAIAPAPYDTTTTRFNDGKVDAAGRFWVGTIYEPRDKQAAEMYVLERGQVRLAWSGGMTNSNGLGFSPDGSAMYHADTAAHRVTRYDFDLASGTQSNPQVLHQFSADKANNYGGRPDGAAVDSEGNYWVAMFEGGRIAKLSPSGEQLDEIVLPVRCPTMVAFGGADLKTLYITTASKRPAEELAAMPLSGRVLQVRVAVPGLPAPAYQP
ncbi:SMP-30/gluconolactonase/LRE family protein [Pseudoduganella aquatica]|nr:SMP-30/gluconolactonase/LRE family protein [Pseudoduganella aquatica]